MDSVEGDDTERRFFQSVDPVLDGEWIGHHATPMWRALREPVVLNLDSTV
jgi:hypothetical protein